MALPGMIPGAGLVAGRSFGVFRDYAMTTTSGNLTTDTVRNVITPPAGIKPVFTQIRVSFASGTARLDVVNASVGIRTGDSGLTDTVSTPVELLFGGSSGFDISFDEFITSDPLVFSFLNTDSLIVVMDVNLTSKTAANVSGDSDTSSLDNGASFATAAPGFVNDITETLGIDLVEGFG